MAIQGRPFPILSDPGGNNIIAPSTRRFTPGEWPQTVFEAQNGAKSIIRYGRKPVGAKLSLSWVALIDQNIEKILELYQEQDDWDYVFFHTPPTAVGADFGKNNKHGLAGIGSGLLVTRMMYAGREPGKQTQSADQKLKWRFNGPPVVTSRLPEISDIACKFVSCFDGD